MLSNASATTKNSQHPQLQKQIYSDAVNIFVGQPESWHHPGSCDKKVNSNFPLAFGLLQKNKLCDQQMFMILTHGVHHVNLHNLHTDNK